MFLLKPEQLEMSNALYLNLDSHLLKLIEKALETLEAFGPIAVMRGVSEIKIK